MLFGPSRSGVGRGTATGGIPALKELTLQMTSFDEGGNEMTTSMSQLGIGL